MSFGAQLRRLRSEAGWTQEELAERAGLTVNGISALERGIRTHPYPHTVRSLADALGLDGDEREELLAAARDPQAPGAVPGRPTVGSGLLVAGGPLVGRTEVVDQLLASLAQPEVRLVTLTGPGGVGKTRLADEVGRLGAHLFPAGVRVVSLAAVQDPGLVMALLVHALGGTRGARAGRGRTLLVVDNFEHLMPAAAGLSDLVRDHPQVTLLVTSRARLRLRFEREVPVAPLQSQPAPPELGIEPPAVALLRDRARAVDPGFEVTEAWRSTVGEICRRLGGLPLALELAAAKLRWLTPPELLARLTPALADGGPRDLPERQQGLRATVLWSYRLLSPGEQTLFRRVSVFAGGFDLETVESVVGELEGDRPVVSLLDALVEQSLVSVARGPGASHFLMLEPIREVGLELLEHHGEADLAPRRHAEWFLGVAQRAVPQYQGLRQVGWAGRPQWETDNLRAAMGWALQRGEGVIAARLGWALWLSWWERGLFDEARRCMEVALDLDLPAAERVRAHVVLASMCDALGDVGASARSWSTALALAREHDDPVGEAYGLAGEGLAAMHVDRDRAAARLAEAVSRAAEVHEQWLLSVCNVWLGTIVLVGGDVEKATTRFRDALEGALERGDRLIAGVALINLGRAALARHERAEAEHHLRRAVELSAEIGDRVNVQYALDLLATLEVGRGNHFRAAVLIGASRALAGTVRVGRNYYLPDTEQRDRTVKEVHEALDEDALQEALGLGAVMDLSSLAEYVGGAHRVREPGH